MKTENDRSHLGIEDRVEIAAGLAERRTATEIASRIGCAKTTVSREVKGHCSVERKGAYGRSFNDCARRNSCAYCSLICCTDKCREYSPYRCGRLARFPFVCNGCEKRISCTLEKRIYSPNEAKKEYEGGLSSSREVLHVTEGQLKEIEVTLRSGLDQTLSRLNRICPPYDKKTFVLDFANTYEDIEKAFFTYFTTTILSNTVTPSSVYDIYRRLMGYYVIDEDDVSKFVDLLYKKDSTDKDRMAMIRLLQKAATVIGNRKLHTEEEAKAIKQTIRHFIRCCEFMIQVTSLEDTILHKTYLYISYLKAFLNNDQPGNGFDLKGKVLADDFLQKKAETHTEGAMISKPELKLSNANRLNRSEEKVKRLSEIIAEINSRTGKSYDEDVAATALLQIRVLLKKNPDLARSARNNRLEDFKMVYDDKIDDALVEGLDQNKDFYTMLLNQPDMKHELMDMFLSDVYTSFGALEVR